jgi:hypothetical protein
MGLMARETGWTCPECRRLFGRRNQSHTCVPAMSLEQYFAMCPPFERRVYDAVAEHLAGVGPLQIEAVSVGIFLRRVRTFAELRPKRDRVVLSFLLSRPLEHDRIVKTWRGPGQRSAYFVDLRDAQDVDDAVRDWLTEAYLTSPT